MRLLRKMVVLHRPGRVPCTTDTHPALYTPSVVELLGAESRINSMPDKVCLKRRQCQVAEWIEVVMFEQLQKEVV